MIPSVTDSPSDGSVTSANVESPTGEGNQRLAESLGKRRVRLDKRGPPPRRWPPIDGEIPGAELFGHPRSGHVHAQDLASRSVGPLLGDDLDDALGVADDLRSAVAAEGILSRRRRSPSPWHWPRSGHRKRTSGFGRWPTALGRSRPHARLAEDALDRHDRLGETNVRELGACWRPLTNGVDVRLAVRCCPSATTKPRSLISTPVPSATRPSVRGRRPTDMTTMSTLTLSPPSMAIVVDPFLVCDR